MLAFFWEGLSPWHLLLILGLALLFYGNRLPDVARSLGRAVNEFKKGLKDVQSEVGREVPDEEPHKTPEKLQAPPEKIPDTPAGEHATEPAERVDASGFDQVPK